MIEKSVLSIDKHSCMGCGLCAEICPKKCIIMAPDKEGFLFPSIDSAACVECGKCLKDCPVNESADSLYHNYEYKYFSSIISDKDMLIRSSSGGMFGAMAKEILKEGGYVCGCVYNDNMVAEHIVTDSQADVDRMFGSKYVQSRANGCFSEIKEILEKGASVLFTGTACQIAALRIYLRRDYEKLFCVEILCHGVPSPKLFEEYVLYLEKKLKGKVLDVQFRNKEKHGWGSEHRTCVVYEKKGCIRKYRPILPAYFSSFFYGLNLRESCYKCRFARRERIADITIGDYWGSWAKYGKRFDEGISVVGVNSGKGESLIAKIKNGFAFYDELTQKEAARSNDNMEHPIKRPRERNDFYKGKIEREYRGLWKKAYFSRTYRRKTLASVYGAFVPAKIRFGIQKRKNKKRR